MAQQPKPTKLRTLEELISIRADARRQGRTFVQCHGCFDVIHPGHIAHLQAAAALGNELLVSVSSDMNVNKGAARPLIPDELRAASLSALACVDHVYINPNPTAVELLKQVEPDVFVKGKEYELSQDPRFLAERDAVVSAGGRVAFSTGDVVFSSTALIGQLTSSAAFDADKVASLRHRYGLTPLLLANAILKFRGKRVVVVGDYLLDRYRFCEATAVASEGPMMTLRSLASKEYDGGAAVLAGHLAAQGAEVRLVTTLPPEHAQLKERLASQSISLSAISARADVLIKERFLADSQKLFKVDHGSPVSLDSKQTALLCDLIFSAAEGADAVILADFGYGTLCAPLLVRLLPRLREMVPIITADVSGKSSLLARLTGIDLITPTERELRDALADHASGLNNVVWHHLSATGTKAAIVTLGKQGLLAFDSPELRAVSGSGATGAENANAFVLPRLRAEHFPALARHVVDPLGCGDSLLATATLALSAGASLQAAAYLGSVAAALHAQKLGNTPVSSDDLLTAVSGGAATESRLAG